MSDYRLSIVAQFDDLVRKRNILSAGADELETEFYKFVKHQEISRQKWCDAEHSAKERSRRNDELVEQNSKLETKLMHAKSQIDIEIRKRIRLETDKSTMDNNIKLVRDILTDKNQSLLNPRDRERLAFLSTDFGGASQLENSPGGLPTIEESASLLSPDISWDNTADDLDVSYKVKTGSNRKKRPSAPPIEEEELTPHDKKRTKPSKSPSKAQRNKKHRRSNSASILTTTTTVTVDNKGSAKAHFTHDNVKHNDSTLRKYPSAGDIKMIDSEEEITPKSGRYSKDLRTPGRPSSLYRNSSAWSLNRPHDFVKTAVLKPEQCVWCEKYMFVRFLKCRDCKVTAHPECKEQVPTPCVPHNVTPSNMKHEEMKITDYAPQQPPYIPALVIHCVKAVESRGLSETGIYRHCGNEREIKQLKADFLRHKGLPNLNSILDIHVICGCLKDFLRGLKEPLITPSLRHDFISAAENTDEDDGLSGIIQAISNLPNANRDTLAFIMVHLQKIAESEECKMNKSNLSIVFGPTIVGYSTAEPDHMQMVRETNSQAMVMESLINISRDYWERLLMTEDEFTTPYTTQTPEGLRSILGPVNTPGDTSTVDRTRNTWNTPSRYASTSRGQRRNIMPYFASPIQ